MRNVITAGLTWLLSFGCGGGSDPSTGDATTGGTTTGPVLGTDAATTAASTVPTGETGAPGETGSNETGMSETGVDEHPGDEIPGFVRCHAGPLYDDLGGSDWPRIHISPDAQTLTVLSPVDEFEPLAEIRRYTRVPAEDCRYALDESFGTTGILMDDDSWYMRVDVEGRIVSSGYATRMIWPNTTDCPGDPLTEGFVDDLGFTDQPGQAYAVGLYDGWRLDFTGDGCGRTPWAPTPYPSSITGVGVDGQGRVHVGTFDAVLIYDPAGAQVGQYQACEDEINCAPGDLERCLGDMCVLDFNARKINRFTSDGTLAGTLDLVPLLDEWDLYPISFSSNVAGDVALLMFGYNGGIYDGKEVILHADMAP